MDFLEFLKENYLWLLVVLIILVISIIGFLADRHEKKKKKMVEEKAKPVETPVVPNMGVTEPTVAPVTSDANIVTPDNVPEAPVISQPSPETISALMNGTPKAEENSVATPEMPVVEDVTNVATAPEPMAQTTPIMQEENAGDVFKFGEENQTPVEEVPVTQNSIVENAISEVAAETPVEVPSANENFFSLDNPATEMPELVQKEETAPEVTTVEEQPVTDGFKVLDEVVPVIKEENTETPVVNAWEQAPVPNQEVTTTPVTETEAVTETTATPEVVTPTLEQTATPVVPESVVAPVSEPTNSVEPTVAETPVQPANIGDWGNVANSTTNDDDLWKL